MDSTLVPGTGAVYPPDVPQCPNSWQDNAGYIGSQIPLLALFVAGQLGCTRATRPFSTIYSFAISPRRNCSDVGGCGRASSNSDCGDGTYCLPDVECGIWAGSASCCYDVYATYKSPAPSNNTCSPFTSLLQNYAFSIPDPLSTSSTRPSSASCYLDPTIPGSYPIAGRVSNPEIIVDSSGTVCCPGNLDSITLRSADGNTLLDAVCIPWVERNDPRTILPPTIVTSTSTSTTTLITTATAAAASVSRTSSKATRGSESHRIAITALVALSFTVLRTILPR
ncbi:hypothetical protein B0A48_10200 [Cryoendolithus antarcticus]|uniref:Uncharacterized protein n=1 Tax=Cryoendolithus antarcticus TaxID=1507870 RepID=A0A1V8SWK7_9PEZI|nr:hypothetical protein B0A48_10200 [Cryoendolithus antarcticus]